MNINITINCDNDAFAGRCGYEAGRILHDLAVSLKGESARVIPAVFDGIKLFDINGNTVGRVTVEE
jgi:hypothetical protein